MHVQVVIGWCVSAAPSARRSDSAQDAMALFLSQRQQGASLPMQASLGAQPPLPAPVMAKHFAAAQLSAGLAQQQQQALSQSAQWSALQGVLRGLTAKTSSADGLATLSAALASSQAAQLGQLGWQAAQQQSRAAPRYPVSALSPCPAEGFRFVDQVYSVAQLSLMLNSRFVVTASMLISCDVQNWEQLAM